MTTVNAPKINKMQENRRFQGLRLAFSHKRGDGGYAILSTRVMERASVHREISEQAWIRFG
jgi:hypothetical protein